MQTHFGFPISEESSHFDSSHDWSIYKATSVLSDSLSMYDDSGTYPSPELGYFSYDAPPKIIKTEPMAELLPADAQHYSDWNTKYIDHWTTRDCLFWLINELQELKVGRALPEVKMENFSNISGIVLKHMTAEDLMQMFPEYGMELYSRLQRIKMPDLYNNYYSFDHLYNTPIKSDEPFAKYPSPAHTLTDLDCESSSSPPTSFSHSTNSYFSPSEADSGCKSDCSEDLVDAEQSQPPPPQKRRPGRPRGTKRKKKPEKLGRLWEFIRDLLLNPAYNPSLICWENYDEGTFRFVHSDKVAKLWGSKKDNIDMNYEKLSRAMRYYYKSKVLQPVYGKRLVYKFGPTATGWRRD